MRPSKSLRRRCAEEWQGCYRLAIRCQWAGRGRARRSRSTVARSSIADAREGHIMKSIEVDRGKPLREQPSKGHNRWHPDIPPVVEVDPGEEVVLQTLDATDGQLGPSTTVADMARLDAG